MKQKILSSFIVFIVNLVFISTVQAGTLDGATQADGTNIAVGLAARALMTNSTAVGESSFALSTSSSAYGAISSATEVNTTAIGTAAQGQGQQSTALGAIAQALGANSTALGVNAMVEAEDGIAIGESSAVLERGGVAIGADALVDAEGSVALGGQSVAREENVVSVGDSETGLTRRITNVAPATSSFDTVNYDQFKRGLSGVRKDAFVGIAGAAAITPATPSAPGKTAIPLGAANYQGQQAIALSLSHKLINNQNNTQINAGIAYNTSHHVLRKVGVSWEF